VTPFFVDGFILFGARVADVVNYRSTVIEQVQEAKQASVDYYTFVRDAYFQHRAALVSDNAGMTKEREEELYYPDTEVKP